MDCCEEHDAFICFASPAGSSVCEIAPSFWRRSITARKLLQIHGKCLPAIVPYVVFYQVLR